MNSDPPLVMLLPPRKEQPAASLMLCCYPSLCLPLSASTLSLFVSRHRRTLPLCPCHVQVNDTKGDVLAYPKTVLELPFSDQDDTYFFADDYQCNCSGDYPDSGSGKVSMLACAKLQTVFMEADSQHQAVEPDTSAGTVSLNSFTLKAQPSS